MTLFLASLFGMFVPIKHLFSSKQELPELFEKEKEKVTFEFYVRRPEKLTQRGPSKLSPITQLSVFIHYREGDVRRAEQSQNCIINVEPLDIVENANNKFYDNPKNFLSCMHRITVHAGVHELPKVN